MNRLEGMIRDTGYDGFLSEEDWVNRASDMRPKEEFREGYMVRCPGVPGCLLGQVMKIDADVRLAKVAWMSGMQGWWYLKDLKVVGIPAERRLLVGHVEEPHMHRHQWADHIQLPKQIVIDDVVYS